MFRDLNKNVTYKFNYDQIACYKSSLSITQLETEKGERRDKGNAGRTRGLNHEKALCHYKAPQRKYLPFLTPCHLKLKSP